MIRWVVLLGVGLAAVGCGKPQPRAPELVVQEAEERKEPEFFDDLEMTPAQRKAVLALLDKLYADFAEYDRTRLLLLDETIKQIKSGELNREKLLPLAEITIADFNEALPLGIEAMQELHGVLTSEQRKQLVSLFTEGRELTPEERRQARNDRIGKVLDLTTGQKAKIYPALLALYIKHWGVIGRFRSALHEAQDEFIEEDFVARDLAIASDLELMAIGEVIFDALEIGMNNLTKEQQQTLAALLDSQLRSPNPTKADEEPTNERRSTPPPRPPVTSPPTTNASTQSESKPTAESESESPTESESESKPETEAPPEPESESKSESDKTKPAQASP